MANSGKLKSTDLPEVVAEQLRSNLSRSSRVLLGLSGGMDSVALFHILLLLRANLGLDLHAMYVDHGISPNASEWGRFCAGLCDAAGVPFIMTRVDLAPNRHLGLEGAARVARYEALGRFGADAILTAHHLDDQAETLLLQLMRGSGVRGLASMVVVRPMTSSRSMLIRPFLHVSRSIIESYATSMGLKWIEDESNADTRYKRNFVRLRIMPALEEVFPNARAAISASAARLSEASTLLDEIADADLLSILDEGGMNVAGLISLGKARSTNAFRRWCTINHMIVPGSDLLAEIFRQLAIARPDSQMEFILGGVSLKYWRGFLHRAPNVVLAPFSLTWQGEAVLKLPGQRGTVCFEQIKGKGIHAGMIDGAPLILRSRSGGEAIQPDCRRPRRTLKNLFQESRLPPWQREQVPLIWCGQELVAVPGIGTDSKWQAQPGLPGWVVTWQPVDSRSSQT
jgi:tRNA(Ile)-lysidine synthase